MVVLTSSRGALDEVLADPDLTVLILQGDPQSRAAAVHALAEEVFASNQTWRRTVLITDPSLLTTEERGWIPDEASYAVLARRTRDVLQGGIEKLLRRDGAPSVRGIRRAFLAGDRG
jgi:hypothetical protein